MGFAFLKTFSARVSGIIPRLCLETSAQLPRKVPCSQTGAGAGDGGVCTHARTHARSLDGATPLPGRLLLLQLLL